MKKKQQLEITAERLERALELASYLVKIHGPDVAPIMDRLKAELAARRRRDVRS
jgi:hypothetical protein